MPVDQKLNFIIRLVDNATAPVNKVSKAILAAQKMASCGFNSMRDGTAGVVASGYGLYKIIEPAQVFSKSMAQLESLGTSAKEIEKVSDMALDFASIYGGSATDIVNSSYDIQSALGNVLQPSELAEYTKYSAILAKATLSDAKTITGYVATMQGVFSDYAKEIGNANFIQQLTGKTAKAVEIFRTTGGEMQAAFANLGGIGSSHGINIDEQFAVIGMLQQVTGSGATAATQYKSFLSGVMKAQDALGLKFTDSKNKMLPMVDILTMIKEKAGGELTSGDLFELEKAFGGKEAAAAISNMIKLTDDLKDNMAKLGAIEGADNAVKMAKILTSPLEALQGAWNSLAISFSMGVQPMLNFLLPIGKVIVTGVSWLMNTIPGLNSVLATVVAGFFAFSAAVSGGVFVIGAFKMILGGTLTIILGFKKVMEWVKFGMFAIQYYTEIWCVKTKLLAFWQKISTAATWAWGIACKGATLLANLVTGSIVWQIISYAAHKVAIYTSIVALGVMKGIMGVLTVVQWAFNAALWACPVTWIVAGILAIIAVVVLAIYYWDEIKAASIAVWDAIVGGVKWCGEILSSFFTWYFNMAKGICDSVLGFFSNLWQGIIDGVLGVWNSVSGIWEKITGVIGLGDQEINSNINKNVNVENNPILSADNVRPDFSDMRNVSNKINNNNTNFGGVKINVAGGFSPSQMAEWQALQC